MTQTITTPTSARTEGREAKRPPRGGGSGALRFFKPDMLSERAQTLKVNKPMHADHFKDFKTPPQIPLKTLKNRRKIAQ